MARGARQPDLPLSGGMQVDGSDLRATIRWSTIGRRAEATISLQWAVAANEAQDTDMIGRALRMLDESLAARGVRLHWIRDDIEGWPDAFADAIADAAGYHEVERRLVLRCRTRRLEPEAGRSARRLDPVADLSAWRTLAGHFPDLESHLLGLPTDEADLVTVTEGEPGLVAYCWARTSRSAPDAPEVAEIHGLGAAPSATPADLRQAVERLLDLLAQAGVGTVSHSVPTSDEATIAALEAIGFTRRRLRRTLGR